MSGVTLSSEFAALDEAFAIGLGEMEWLTLNALKSAFAPFDERLRLINEVVKPGYAHLRAEQTRVVVELSPSAPDSCAAVATATPYRGDQPAMTAAASAARDHGAVAASVGVPRSRRIHQASVARPTAISARPGPHNRRIGGPEVAGDGQGQYQERADDRQRHVGRRDGETTCRAWQATIQPAVDQRDGEADQRHEADEDRDHDRVVA